MPSVKNPNTVSRNRQIARAAKARKQSLKAATSARRNPTRIDKSDARRGARPGLLPTSGPNRALSKKKQRKLEKLMAHAIRRKEQADAAKEVEMEGKFRSGEVRNEGDNEVMADGLLILTCTYRC